MVCPDCTMREGVNLKGSDLFARICVYVNLNEKLSEFWWRYVCEIEVYITSTWYIYTMCNKCLVNNLCMYMKLWLRLTCTCSCDTICSHPTRKHPSMWGTQHNKTGMVLNVFCQSLGISKNSPQKTFIRSFLVSEKYF